MINGGAPQVGFPSTLGASLPADSPAEEDLLGQPPIPDPLPLPPIEDATLLQIMQATHERSRSARETRRRLNRRNWDALHGKFDFLAKKRPGQSQIVIPSLETSLEQICAQLTEQLVGFSQWFTASYEGDAPPLPGLDADSVARMLKIELERLAVDGGCMPTTYGMHRLIYDSLKLGLIESEVCWKVQMVPETSPVYAMAQGQMTVESRSSMRLRVDLVPFDDFYPDPSAAKAYMIHEVTVAIADLPGMGFTKDQINSMRHAAPGTEKLEEQRRRSGLASSMPSPTHQVLLREYWGDLVHPQTGDLIAEKVTFMTAANTTVVKPPERIQDLHWCGFRPFIHVPLLPTPTSEQHHAFLDIAVPLVEAECELFNLITDSGFHASLGVKQIRPHYLMDPTVLAKGLTAGMEIELNETIPAGADAITKVDTGTLSQEVLTVFDRIARTRQEATRTSDLQLGHQAARKTSATEINEISQSSDDLFSNLALRFEDTAIEPLLELCWLYLWQDADEPMVQRMAAVLPPPFNGMIGMLSPEERFVAFANGVNFKVQGYKYQLQSTKDTQVIMQAFQFALQNPAFMQVLQQKVDLTKFYMALLRSKGIDPKDFEPDQQTMPMDPALMAGQAGNPQGGPPNPAENPQQASQQGQMNPPNMQGERGIQAP